MSSVRNIIYYYSDLHQEHNLDRTILFKPEYKKNDIENNYILILAGDIGSPVTVQYWDLIKTHTLYYNHIIILCGNHEYYGHNIDYINSLMTTCIKEYKLENRVHFLNNSSITINNIKFVGSTLWSYIPDEHKEEVTRYMNDYNYIKDFTTDINNKLHRDSVNYLKSELETKNENNTIPIIVITHYSPSFIATSHPMYTGKTTNCAFSSNLDYLIEKCNYWIFGHTHYNYYNIDNKYKLKSNQLGYNWDRPIRGFNKNTHLNIITHKNN